VAVVNREFARKVFGSVDKRSAVIYKRWGGKRVEVVGVVEDGKYEPDGTPQPAMFLFVFCSSLGAPGSSSAHSTHPERSPARCNDPAPSILALALDIKSWNSDWLGTFAARGWPGSSGVLGGWAHARDHRHFRMASYR